MATRSLPYFLVTFLSAISLLPLKSMAESRLPGKGTVVTDLYYSGSVWTEGTEGHPHRLHYGKGWFWQDRLSLHASGFVSYVDANASASAGQSDVFPVGLNIGFRLWVFSYGPVSFYLDGHTGIQYSIQHSFPTDGTHLNFDLVGGGGIVLHRDDALSWNLGVRFVHLSNANLYEQNSGYDGIQIAFGPIFEF